MRSILLHCSVLAALLILSQGRQNVSQSLVSAIVNSFPSPDRTFFVKVWAPEIENFCGGALIGRQWVATSTKCLMLINTKIEHLKVTVADFTKAATREPVIHSVLNGWARGRDPNDKDGVLDAHELLLLKLRYPVSREYQPIPLCDTKTDLGDYLGALGLGYSDTSLIFLPKYLREGLFIETDLLVTKIVRARDCPPDKVCVIGYQHGVNLCVHDLGGPLYQIDCVTQNIICLYGIADSFHNGKEKCDDGSLFESIVFHLPWIMETMDVN